MKKRPYNRKTSTLLNILFFLSILLLLTFGTARILKNKDGITRHTLFYEEKNTIDALFFGSSHTESGISPLDLWNRYGICSYNMGNHGERIPVSYWIAKDSMKRNKPKMIFLDMFMVNSDFRPEWEESQGMTWMSLDSMPLSLNKIQAIEDLFPCYSIPEKMEYIFTFSKYHQRWKDLTKSDFVYSYRLNNGAISYENSAMLSLSPIPPKEDESYSPRYMQPPDINIYYLNKLVELCTDNNVNLVLVYFPYQFDNANADFDLWLQDFAANNSIIYINMNSIDIGLNYDTDFFDSGHLNALGFQKTTDYLGSFIQKQSFYSDKRNNPTYSYMNDRYEEYTELKNKKIGNKEDINKEFYSLLDE